MQEVSYVAGDRTAMVVGGALALVDAPPDADFAAAVWRLLTANLDYARLRAELVADRAVRPPAVALAVAAGDTVTVLVRAPMWVSVSMKDGSSHELTGEPAGAWAEFTLRATAAVRLWSPPGPAPHLLSLPLEGGVVRAAALSATVTSHLAPPAAPPPTAPPPAATPPVTPPPATPPPATPPPATPSPAEAGPLAVAEPEPEPQPEPAAELPVVAEDEPAAPAPPAYQAFDSLISFGARDDLPPYEPPGFAPEPYQPPSTTPAAAAPSAPSDPDPALVSVALADPLPPADFAAAAGPVAATGRAAVPGGIDLRPYESGVTMLDPDSSPNWDAPPQQRLEPRLVEPVVAPVARPMTDLWVPLNPTPPAKPAPTGEQSSPVLSPSLLSPPAVPTPPAPLAPPAASRLSETLWVTPSPTPASQVPPSQIPAGQAPPGQAAPPASPATGSGPAAGWVDLAPATRPVRRPSVWALRCPLGHANPPRSVECRGCGTVITDQEATILPRPSLGRLDFGNGQFVGLDETLLIGREPGDLGPDGPRPVVLDHASLSRRHLEVRLHEWMVVVIDLNSQNGTTVELPGRGPLPLNGFDPVPIPPGTVVRLAHEVPFRFVTRYV